MFTKILIANRGEIACRVATTARRMGIRTVAVYSDADVQAKHVALCDEAVHIGGNAPRDSYLRGDRILAAALATGAQAIHPGYGFLSENADFARQCQTAGVVFIGPPPAAIEAMGLKAQSKRLMEQARVPLVPGYHGADQAPALLQAEATRIGYPVLIKASAGGGGKGMRIVERETDFADALASCQREARNSFGDDAVLVEKYVQRPRHIEIQVFADTQGQAVYLFERDCSVQRRHQKVLEEAPAPGLPESIRQSMGQAAVAAALAVGYVGAGTVEFIVEQPGGYDAPEQMRFYFMEMNTRLQVEHPVTEAITGLDLVQWQLHVAAGQPLPLRQDDLRRLGHAIEARICAEAPDRQFLPATGTLVAYRKPSAAAFEHGPVRIDDGVREGDAISPHYDSMIAKLIVHGDTREQALAQLDAALAQLVIVGLDTNVQFLRHVLATPSFAQGLLDTALIARESDRLFHQEPVGLPWAAAALAAHRVAERAAAVRPGDPFSAADGWRLSGPLHHTWQALWRGQAVSVQLRQHRGALALRVADADWLPLHVHGAPTGQVDLQLGGQRLRAQIVVHGRVLHLHAAAGSASIEWADPTAADTDAGHAAGGLAAPMPGKVVSFAVKAGDTVAKGQVLAVMEAMKMEHSITAPQDGTVDELLYAPGDQVSEGAALLTLAAA
jgi:3-methylcrotonyl-CoA carboxylase alpha subunit